MHLLLTSALTTTLMLFNPTPALATSFVIPPFSEFAKTTENIIRGNLHDIHVENGITADGSKTIYTYATVDVKENLKGNIRSASIQVRKIGGTKDGMTLEVPSSPEFIENEDTVLFLSGEKEDRSYEVNALELGKFSTREENGETYLEGGLFGFDEHTSAAPEPSPAPSENQHPWSIKQLKELLVKQGAEPPPPPVATQSLSPSTSPSSPNPENKSNPSPTLSPSTSSDQDEGTPTWVYGAGVLLAVGIFLFFRRRN